MLKKNTYELLIKLHCLKKYKINSLAFLGRRTKIITFTRLRRQGTTLNRQNPTTTQTHSP